MKSLKPQKKLLTKITYQNYLPKLLIKICYQNSNFLICIKFE